MDRTQDQEPVPQRSIKLPDNVHHHPPQKCPRCDSSNTKFCYYNNHSLSQPRYFCKCCRRYWTHGGTLRNVPIGGGCRKSKHPKCSVPSTSTTEIVTRTQPISAAHFAGMGQGLWSDTGTSNNYINNNYLYKGGAILSTLSAMQGINHSPVGGRFGGNVTLLHGVNLSSLGPFQSPRQLGNGAFQLPVSSWAQGFVNRGDAASSGGGRPGFLGGGDHVGSSFNPNNQGACDGNNHRHHGFNPSK